MSGLEKKDFDQIINALEDNYRHDLAVHLYLAFLSHNVNPHFPQPKWASWPVEKSDLPDLNTSYRYEDQIDDKTVEDTIELCGEVADESIPVTQEAVDGFFPTRQRISVTYKNSDPVGPSALLLNELQALILRKVHRKASARLRDRVELTLDDNNVLTRQMTLKLAQRLHSLLEKMSQAKHSDSRRTWQDVHLKALMFRDHGKGPDIKGHRKRYARSKRLFDDVKFNYEYSLAHYAAAGDEEADSEMEFEVNHHLDALDTEKRSKRRRTMTASSDILAKAKEAQHSKENLFNKLCTEAESAQCFSWKSTDRLSKFSPSDTHLSEERVAAVATSTLSGLDYIGEA